MKMTPLQIVLQEERVRKLHARVAKQREQRRMGRCLHHAHEPDQLSRREGVIRSMTVLIIQKLGVSEGIALKFARTQTFIHLNTINCTRQLEAMEKRASRKRKHHA